jgi:transposase-like protein
MSTTKKKAVQGIRYTDAQKKEVVDFVTSYNKANGRGGQSQAATKFKMSQITVASWLKGAGTTKGAKVEKAEKATTVAKPVKATSAKQAAIKVGAGTRYTPEQKAEVLAFVASHNAANGRGGQSTAAAKFNISPLTVMAWLKKSGAPKASKAVKSVAATTVSKAPAPAVQGSIDGKLSSLLSVIAEISKTEVELAHLKAKAASIQASF